MTHPQPCIGLLEFGSIAAGIEATDAMLKDAPVDALISRPVSPGKYVVLITGGVDDVKSALRSGRAGREGFLVDELVLPNVFAGIFPALSGTVPMEPYDALGVIETYSVASTVVASDIAGKHAEVRLLRIRLADGLGGKSYVAMTGEVSNVRSSVGTGADSAREKRLLVAEIVIPRPHPTLMAFV